MKRNLKAQKGKDERMTMGFASQETKVVRPRMAKALSEGRLCNSLTSEGRMKQTGGPNAQ